MITTILLFIVILIVLVLVHEIGHFTAAKLLGIKVEEFGFGLPPRLWGKKFGETIYSVNALPIGGFVRLYGEDEKSSEVVKSEKSRAFFAKKPWQRSIVLTAGVTMNLILGWVVYTYLFTQGVQVPTNIVTVQAVSKDSPAEKAGIQIGDEIVRIQAGENNNDKSTINTPEDLVTITGRHLGENMSVTLSRNGEESTILLIPRNDPPEGEGAIGVTISNLAIRRYNIIQAPWMAAKQIGILIQSLIIGLGSILWRAITFHSVGAEVTGPVGIGKLVGQARQFGSAAVFETVALLSVNLAVINIAPFPALDGGRLLFVIVEWLTGKKVNPTWETYLHQAGMIILLFLLLLITISDVFKLRSGLL